MVFLLFGFGCAKTEALLEAFRSAPTENYKGPTRNHPLALPDGAENQMHRREHLTTKSTYPLSLLRRSFLKA